jgi:glyoxylase-like metal-dependent hydrolase (beta-lactamase superfamily II)
MTIPAYLHCLTLPTPFPIGPVNVYLLEGQVLTLVDTGPKADVSRAALESGLASLGYHVEDLRRIVVTHHHVDHMGLAAEIVARSGAEIWTHPYNLPWMADYAAQQRRCRPFYARIWEEAGVPGEIMSLMNEASLGLLRWMDPVPATYTLEEGQLIELGASQWRVYHTPGHAGGLVCLWDPASRTLLANDHFIRDISSNPVLEPPPAPNGPRPRRLVEYLHHMRRMAALSPEVALPGHGEPVTDVDGLVRHRQAFHERRADRLLESLDGSAASLWELTQIAFPRVQRGMEYFLALSEVLAHLDLLEEEGRVQAQMRDGGVRWLRRR